MTRPVILFDGVCHLCNGFVQFILRRDSAAQFDFAPLQSKFARAQLGKLHLDGVVLIENGEIIHAERAALRILARLGFPWSSIAKIGGWFPRPVLAWGYNLIARYRYRIFGKEETCMLPRPEWKSRFLS